MKMKTSARPGTPPSTTCEWPGFDDQKVGHPQAERTTIRHNGSHAKIRCSTNQITDIVKAVVVLRHASS
ncbi:hypothetical protein ACTFBT_37995 [Streptomyces microflavus]|uniref:hypothetical protein n=1 Tax=Streptomyces TaxID=1883 RepID=UPI00167E285B|nr:MULTISPECIES: hypothetical protein [Streptomyces]